jgi:hypothetical protein
VGPLVEPHGVRIVAYWLVTLSFTCTLWAARMSMLVSIVRITPTVVRAARYTRWLLAAFAAMWAALLLQKAVLCALDRSWYRLPAPQCHLGQRVAILELSSACARAAARPAPADAAQRTLWRTRSCSCCRSG